MDEKFFIDLAGWSGSLAVIAAYILVSYEKMPATHKGYQYLNLVGSILLIINTAYHGAFPSTFVNLVWAIIAILALYRLWRRYVNDNAVR